MAASPNVVNPLPALSSLTPVERPSPSGTTPTPTAGTITSKEWVIPPRPKPGRKPATDSPPSKRKAQNRTAQRAFRERRAAKVRELEEQMKEMEESFSKERDELKLLIGQLESSVEQFKVEVLAWKEKCRVLEEGLRDERKLKEDVERIRELEREAPGREDKHQLGAQPQDEEGYNQVGQVPELMGCGNCTQDTRCECFEQVLRNSNVSFSSRETAGPSKRPHTPEDNSRNKRQQSITVEHDSRVLETDFTGFYSSSQPKQAPLAPEERTGPTTIITNPEPCGFCQDGTACVCAELAQSRSETAVRPTLSYSFTPPPAEGDVYPSYNEVSDLKPPNFRPTNTNKKSCTNQPGTCPQCLSDPNSTIFCKSLASLRRQTQTGPSSTTTTTTSSRSNQQEKGVYLSCADTYTTLSRHEHYSAATDELDTWLGKLKTSIPADQAGNRAPMEIEAASVMGVLKFFDRRFGRG